MDNTWFYENQKRQCSDKIVSEQSILRETRKLADSLDRFKRTVQETKNDYSVFHRNTKAILDPVWSVQKNNLTAKKYYSGMTQYFQSMGSGVVLLALNGVLMAVSIKRGSYERRILEAEISIQNNQNKIRDLDRKIREEKTKTVQEN